MDATQQKKLLIYEYELKPSEQKLVQVCALLGEPISRTNLLQILRKSKTPSWSNVNRAGGLDPYIRNLQSHRLLDEDLMCIDSMQEIIARKAAREDGFRHMADCIRSGWPAEIHEGRRIRISYDPGRLIRDLRLAMLSHDSKRLVEIRDLIEYHFGHSLDYTLPFLPLISNPFDPDWMQTLPLDIQVNMLIDTLYFSVWTGEENPAIWDYASNLQLTSAVSKDIQDRFLSLLVKRMFLGWDLPGAEKAMAGIHNPLRIQALKGWQHFLQGEPEQAVRQFEQALVDLCKMHRSKKFYFSDECGLITALSLIKLNNRESWERLQAVVDLAQHQSNASQLFSPAYLALQGVLSSREMQLDVARHYVQEAEKKNIGLLAHWITLQARFWVDRKLSDWDRDQLYADFQKVHSHNMKWLTFELGTLLEKEGRKTFASVEAKTVAQLRLQNNMTPMADVLQQLEPWQQALHALQEIAGSFEAQDSSPEYRLVWLVEPRGDGSVELQPKLQKQKAKGQWTKGRNVALSKLYHQTGEMDFLTLEDQNILRALRYSYGSYGQNWYTFDSQKVLSTLVGHPRLFLSSTPEIQVEFVQGEPEIKVEESQKGYILSMNPDIKKDTTCQVIQETPTRFKVLQVTPEHKRIASILRNSWFSVPKSGYEELVRTVSSLSTLVTVHSDIQDLAGHAVQVQADSRPCVQITPAGSGFRVEMTVRPLSASGPALKPGSGQTSLLAEVQGQRMHTTRDLEEEKALARSVEQACAGLAGGEDDDLSWTIADPESCLQLLTQLKELQDQDQISILWPEGEKLTVTRRISLSDLHLKLGKKQSWLEMSGEVEVDEDTVLDLRDLLQAAPTTRFVPLDQNRYVALSRNLRRRLQEIKELSESQAKSVKLPASSALFLDGLVQEVGSFEGDQAWSERRKAILEVREYTPVLPSTLKAELRDYQIQGYQWLSRMARMGLGACLADDMGLGKTLQALALIVERAPEGPGLVIAPTSVCSNWVAEAQRFAPTLEPVLYAGKDRKEVLSRLGPFQVLICSYALLMQDSEDLTQVFWQTLVLDEAQAIKNWGAKRTQAAMQLQAGFRMATTGTPLENNLSELWSLFRFLNPGLLGPRKRFHERFAVPIQKYRDQERRKVLQKIIRPFILRRLKSQVMEELPARTEVTLRVSLSREEASLYEAVRQNALEKLENTQMEPGQKHFRILAELTRLRQLCCHPQLVFPDSRVTSSKMALLEEVVFELLANAHKVLIFSQFVKNLHLVQKRLDHMGVGYRYLDGSTPAQAREQEIAAFQAGHGDVFLISLKAGGTGINLTAADYVIHLDPWWNPAVEDQAADRTHRIGQDRPVTVYRLVAENTVEEKIVRLHAEKRELADGLLDGSDVSHQVDAEELMQLLRHDGAWS